MTAPTRPRYSTTAICLHWVLAVAIVSAFAVGLYVEDLPFSPQKLKLINWHKWAGVTILALSVLRLAWRLTHRPPALPVQVSLSMPGWQMLAYHATHHLLPSVPYHSLGEAHRRISAHLGAGSTFDRASYTGFMPLLGKIARSTMAKFHTQQRQLAASSRRQHLAQQHGQALHLLTQRANLAVVEIDHQVRLVSPLL